MDSTPSLQQITARALFPNQKEVESQLVDSPILTTLKKFWNEERIAAYIADAVYYPRRYRDLINGVIRF